MTLYEKRGRRYVPVLDDGHRHLGLSEGDYFVSVRPGQAATISLAPVGEAFAAMAAIPDLEDFICAQLREHARLEPAGPLVGKALKAWNAYEAVLGEDARLILKRGSNYDVARAVAKAIAAKARGAIDG